MDTQQTETSSAFDLAQSFADRLSGSFPAVEAVCLFGSVARDEAGPLSDIDVLVLGADPSLTPTSFLRGESPSLRDRLSVIYYTTSEFLRHHGDGALFVAHILREGKALLDRHGLLANLLDTDYTPSLDYRVAVARELEKLTFYDDPSRFHGNFLFALSHLFSIGKSVVMLRLAQAGLFEFDKRQAFRKFKRLFPNEVADANEVESLMPYYSTTQRSGSPELSDHRGSEQQLQQAVSAIRRLAET